MHCSQDVQSILSSIFPIIYIAIGAMIGFFSNYMLEKMRIKRDVYFEVLDLTSRISELLEQWNLSENKEESVRRIAEWEMSFDAALLKLEICGSEEIKRIASDIKKVALDYKAIDVLNKQLTQLMRRELLPAWWQFWRR